MLSFSQYLLHQQANDLKEHVLSIGLNPKHEKYRDQHRGEMHDMLHNAYKSLGGYSGLPSGSKEESDSIHKDISDSAIKATKRNGKITSISLYKLKNGRKGIASATDTSRQGISDFLSTVKADHQQKRSWAEVSHAPEKLFKKTGMPVVPNHLAKELTGKHDIEPHEDGEHYSRKIGTERHTKVIMGHPKLQK